jgi:hypothetical protein
MNGKRSHLIFFGVKLFSDKNAAGTLPRPGLFDYFGLIGIER